MGIFSTWPCPAEEEGQIDDSKSEVLMAYRLVKKLKGRGRMARLAVSKRKRLTKKGAGVGTAFGGLSLHQKVIARSFSSPLRSYAKAKLKIRS